MSRFRFGDMESLLLGLEEELRVAAQAAVQGVVARTRQEVKRVLEAARREREAGVQEVARLRAELAQEVAAMQKVQASHRSRVVLDIGGVRQSPPWPRCAAVRAPSLRHHALDGSLCRRPQLLLQAKQ